jgi:hypothetical protein
MTRRPRPVVLSEVEASMVLSMVSAKGCPFCLVGGTAWCQRKGRLLAAELMWSHNVDRYARGIRVERRARR